MSKPIVAMKFEMVIDEPGSVIGHTRFRCEGWLNDGLREHLPRCMECRSILAKDLRDFATQIEIMGPDAIRWPESEGKMLPLGIFGTEQNAIQLERNALIDSIIGCIARWEVSEVVIAPAIKLKQELRNLLALPASGEPARKS